MKPAAGPHIESQAAEHRCGLCRHFCNTPAAIEAAFQGLSSMGSATASVRAQDGLCNHHGLYLSYRDCCPDFFPATESSERPK
jgi:hypothetical protein